MSRGRGCRRCIHRHVADDQQAGGAAVLDARVVDRAERARQKVDWNQPSRAGSQGRRRQGDDASGDGGHRLVGREHDGPAAIRHRQAAGERVFLDGNLEEVRHVVQADEFLPADQRGLNRAPALA